MKKEASPLAFFGCLTQKYCFFALLLALCACSTQKRGLSQKQVRRLNNTDTYVSDIIEAARSYRGTPYRWGGTTRAGMDCSGLLVVAFQQGGKTLPRTSQEQSRVGQHVNLYELKPGDLVFFAAKKGSPYKITHVGMVTEIRDKTDVQFIHASTKLGVVENNIYSDYYRRIFVKARRPF